MLFKALEPTTVRADNSQPAPAHTCSSGWEIRAFQASDTGSAQPRPDAEYPGTERDSRNLDPPPPSSPKLQRRMSLQCCSQAPSDIFCRCLFKCRSDRRGIRPVVNPQQDTKQLSSGREKDRGGNIYFSERMEHEKEGERGFSVKAGIWLRCIFVMRWPNSAP